MDSYLGLLVKEFLCECVKHVISNDHLMLILHRGKVQIPIRLAIEKVVVLPGDLWTNEVLEALLVALDQ